MGFAGAGAADEDRVTLGVEEAAGGEFTHQSFIDRRVRKDELVDILENRELGAADTIADRAGLPMTAFGPDQAGDERIDLITSGKTLAGDLVEAGVRRDNQDGNPATIRMRMRRCRGDEGRA